MYILLGTIRPLVGIHINVNIYTTSLCPSIFLNVC